MQTPIYLRSMCPNTMVYAWTSGRVWEGLDPKAPLPGSFFLANQVGIEAGCYGAVDIDSFQSLLQGMTHIHMDLFLDAIEIVGLRNPSSISQARWYKLSRPRPVKAPEERSNILTLYASLNNGSDCFELNVERNGSGGWFRIDSVPEVEMSEVFDMWDYKVFVPKHEGVAVVPASCCKRLITSIFDNLYMYDLEDASLKSYLAYAQPLMKAMWERRATADANKRLRDGVHK